MPPRSRTTPSTAPAGRRPKVAGLRDPRRQGTAGEPTPAAGPEDAPKGTATVASPEAPATGSPVTSSPETPAAETGSPADVPAPSTPADEVAAADAPPTTGGDDVEADARPAADPAEPKRRPARAMTPTGASSRRGGTAVLDRPAPARPAPAAAAPSTAERGESRGARFAGAVTRPFAALGANPKRLMAVLAAVIVVCLALATLAFVAARGDRAEGQPYANGAVVDVAGTAEVVGQTRGALESILSYDFTKLDDSVNAARTQSTGEFTTNYLQVFDQTIRGPATEQKLRQSATVLNIGVQDLTADRASLLAFVQFTAERTTNNQTTNAPGLLAVQVVRQDGRWKITELKPL